MFQRSGETFSCGRWFAAKTSCHACLHGRFHPGEASGQWMACLMSQDLKVWPGTNQGRRGCPHVLAARNDIRILSPSSSPICWRTILFLRVEGHDGVVCLVAWL